MENIIKYIILPSNLITLFFIAGVIFFFLERFKRFGVYLLFLTLVLYIVFASGPVSSWLLGNLEYQYPCLQNPEKIKSNETIVLLTGYAELNQNIPLSSRVNSPSAFRLLETVRIFNKNTNATIIISSYGDLPNIMKELLVSVGLPTENIVVENESKSTHESADNVKRLIGNRSFILVTSAGHMPRSVKVFNNLGMNPIPAPTDYLTRKNYLAISYLPKPLNLRYSDLAIHEYIAMLWYHFTKRI